MKIQNKFIKIKNGNKEITLQNTILKYYLGLLETMQFQTTSYVDSQFYYTYLKFDDKLIVDFENNYLESDFDARFEKKHVERNYANNQITADYIYEIDKRFLSMWYGHKITAIGFGTLIGIGAVVDTSNYDIYLYENSELQIYRRDIYKSDGLFSTNDNVGMYHILPNGDYKYQNNVQKFIGEWGVIESIGLGVSKGQMLEEYPIMINEDIIMAEDYQSFIIDKELTIERESEGLYPSLDLYPSQDLYPARVIREGLYPSEDIYPAIDIYPVETLYQYVIIKYRIFSYNGFENNRPIATNKFYTISNKIPNGIEKIKEELKYEVANF